MLVLLQPESSSTSHLKSDDVVKNIIVNITKSLNAACAKQKIDLVALSGGLDSSIIAWHAVKQSDSGANGIAIIADDFVSPDLVYCQMASHELDIPLVMLNLSTDKILDGIKETIKILKNFNEIEIRNSVVMYLAAKWAVENGYTSIATGDGADELFAGYKFLINTPEDKLEDEIQRVCSTMHFPSHVICKTLGISAISPFLDADVIKLAKTIDHTLKVRDDLPKNFNNSVKNDSRHNPDNDDCNADNDDCNADNDVTSGDNSNDNNNCNQNSNTDIIRDSDTIRYGKWILRKSFENTIPYRIAWRPKYAMQDGSGTVGLTELFNSIMRVDEESYVAQTLGIKTDDDVIIRNRESLHYYEIFRELYGKPSEFNSDKLSSCDGNNNHILSHDAQRRCPYCKFVISNNVRFCKMCAAFPI